MAARAKVNLMQPEVILLMKGKRKDTSDKLFDVKSLVCTSLTGGDLSNLNMLWTACDFPSPKERYFYTYFACQVEFGLKFFNQLSLFSPPIDK